MLRPYDFENPLLVSAEILLGTLDAAAELGIDISEPLKSNNIDLSVLENPKGFLAYHQLVQFLEQVANDSACPLFGFYVAKFQPPMQFGLMTQLTKLCSTVGESLEKGLKYSQIYNQESQWVQDKDTGFVFMKRRHRVVFPGVQIQLHLLAISLMIKAAGEVMGSQLKLNAIYFSHSRPDDSDIMSRYFNAPIYYDHEFDGFAFPEFLLNRPLTMAYSNTNIELMAIVESHMQGLLDEHLLPQSLSQRIYQQIKLNLGTNTCNVVSIAQLMGLHPRALQRSLKKQKVSFRTLLSQARLEVAVHYLSSSNIQLGDLSDILGYQNVSAFSRAFKHSTGLSPESWKKTVIPTQIKSISRWKTC